MIIDGQRKKKGKRKEKNFLLAAYKKEKRLTAEKYFLKKVESRKQKQKEERKIKRKEKRRKGKAKDN